MPVNPANPAGPATTSGTAQSSGAPVSVGIVLVSHSRSLAESALDLARRLIVAVDVPVELAAGLADGALGTDPGRRGQALPGRRPLTPSESLLERR